MWVAGRCRVKHRVANSSVTCRISWTHWSPEHNALTRAAESLLPFFGRHQQCNQSAESAANKADAWGSFSLAAILAFHHATKEVW
mmetsp:Transcript_26509/g.51908  ORF Transcript_26509/g.51908 Transcript_26509/m.51908 type:complete len:85 (-) Transcript_26509:64-318(-)